MYAAVSIHPFPVTFLACRLSRHPSISAMSSSRCSQIRWHIIPSAGSGSYLGSIPSVMHSGCLSVDASAGRRSWHSSILIRCWIHLCSFALKGEVVVLGAIFSRYMSSLKDSFRFFLFDLNTEVWVFTLESCYAGVASRLVWRNNYSCQ